ncbi:uncharacterized protein LOC127535992 [Acanthochromis polyacanthus]|uniref:uncharacterized protein LOC127535992 n=1 Tax=Acanthochromis polyacanthus TaxID=80966 RepID=UPI002234DACF|nr:uncharacterized protein LOC127535992 [Acanthochromis polyacanthus]
MMPPEDTWTQLTPKEFGSAFAPFPRYTWIHPNAPTDSFDRVCKVIWSRAKWPPEKPDGGESSEQRSADKNGISSGRKPSRGAEEQQKETDDLSVSMPYEKDKKQYHTDFILPCPYLSGRRYPHVAQTAWVASSVMKIEMELNKEDSERKRKLEKDVGDKQRSMEDSVEKIPVSQSEPKTQPLLTDPVCSAPNDHTLRTRNKKPLPRAKLRRETCESEDEQDARSRSSSKSSDDDTVTLPGLKDCATDSCDDDTVSDTNEVKENNIPHSPDELSSDSVQDSPSSMEKDCPPLPTRKAGIKLRPTRPSALGKMRSQWEIPLSFHPDDIPTATLASAAVAPVQAAVQRKGKAPRANSKTNGPPPLAPRIWANVAAAAVPVQQPAYDLLADFPALQPSEKPFVLGVLHHGNPKTKAAKGKRGLTHSTNRCQDSGVSHEKRLENVAHEVRSICAGDQKSTVDFQTLGLVRQSSSPTISCEELRANNKPPPRGTDGMPVNARTWASAAKAGMKQAAAPQEKARPCTFQQIVTINGAKAGYSAALKFSNKVTPSHLGASPRVTASCQGPPLRNLHRFVKPGYSPALQFGSQAHRANCPPRHGCPCLPVQQGGGVPKSHVR